MAMGNIRFMTLTLPGETYPDGGVELLTKGWKRLSLRIARRFGRIEYFGVVELQVRGVAHLHIVYRGPFIPQPWLSAQAAAVGLGRIADIRRPHNGIVAYLTKQLRTDAAGALPAGVRRIRASLGWSLATRADRPSWNHWLIADAQPAHAVAALTAAGYTVADNGTGPPSRMWNGRRVRFFPAGPFPRVASFTSLPSPAVAAAP
jgi:hypothetical protein